MVRDGSTLSAIRSGLPSLDVAPMACYNEIPDDDQLPFRILADSCNVNLGMVDHLLRVTSSLMTTYVVIEGHDNRSKGGFFDVQSPWSDVMFATLHTNKGQYAGKIVSAQRNIDHFANTTDIPFIANVEVQKCFRGQGHGMRLVSLMHRLSQIVWNQPVSAGPEEYISPDGTRLAKRFADNNWLKDVSLPHETCERVGNG